MRKVFFLSFILCLCCFLSGCASAPRNYSPEIIEKNYPPLGKIVSAEVGEEMLVQGYLLQAKVLRINQEEHIWAYTITPGNFIKIGEDDEYEYFSSTIGSTSGTIRPISGQPDFSASIMFNKKTNETCIIRPTDATVCGQMSYYFSSISVEDSRNFQQTLIYSGKNKEKISISYREYLNNIARPAYFNNVEYDLNESNIIGYKGARIEIIEANNTKIVYSLLNDFTRE